MTRIFLLSNLATALMAALFALCAPSLGLLLICILLLVPYLLVMLRWGMQCEHADQSMLPMEPGPLADEPLFPKPIKLVGANDKPRANLPPNLWRGK